MSAAVALPIYGTSPIKRDRRTKADIADLRTLLERVLRQYQPMTVRQVFYRRDPETKERIEEVTLFTKWRDVGGGVQWPFNILRERNGEKIFEIFSDSVTINHNLSDDLFTLPANTKALKPERN